ncbi:hypothetical protein AgCh_022290 [Apium graveolens]
MGWKNGREWGRGFSAESKEREGEERKREVVFAGFSAESVAQRISDCKPKVLITCNAVMRGSKLIRLKQIVDAALTESSKNGFSLGMKVYSTEEKELIMEPTLKWAGNPNILVAAKAYGLKATVQIVLIHFF